MMFGSKGRFGIEIGEVETIASNVYCQFRFWMCDTPVGDWEDRISLHASAEYMRQFCQHQYMRIDRRFEALSANEIIAEVHDAFFHADPVDQFVDQPDLRDIFHLDDIGMSATIDKYSIVLVSPSALSARLVVKDWTAGGIVRECPLQFGDVERAGVEYVSWAHQKLSSLTG